MANKMLIDATHPEETRVVVLRGNRVEEFDFESANRKQLRGNIYLAKVTRVEPSLQAAFVDYGGNRHGFLAFSEIHPDYYQIPVADRQALIDEEERAQRAAEDEADRRSRRHRGGGRNSAARRDANVVRGDVVEAARDSESASEERTEDHGEAGEAPTVAQGFAETTADETAVEAEDTEGPTTLPEDQLISAFAPTKSHDSVATHGDEAAETGGTSEERHRRAIRRDRRADRRRRACAGSRRRSRRPRGRHWCRRRSPRPRRPRRPRRRRRAWRRERRRRGDRRIGRRRRRAGGSSRPRAALPPAVQNPGSDQAAPGHAGAGGQGGARHQGRGAHHLSVARRPLFGVDAQYRARRRHQPQDHQRRRPLEAQGDRRRTRGAGRHGRDRAHRRREPHQDRDQARLRVSVAAVGDSARPDAEIDRADARLRGRLAGQALDPRPLQQGNRRGHRRRPRGL